MGTRFGVLFMIVLRSMRQHVLSTTITILSAALASGLVMGVFTVTEQSKTAFTGGDIGYDAVLGAKGSPVQLVLSTVYHADLPTGNIPLAEAQRVGYMGHDHFEVVDGVLWRSFPLYANGDANAAPTGGTRRLRYDFDEHRWVEG